MFLTSVHLIFATLATQVLRKTTNLLDDLKDVNMDFEKWSRNILPIGVVFSFSLALSNLAYLTLSVSFIQMLKAATPVIVLLQTALILRKYPTWQKVVNVLVIVFGVMLTTLGELEFTLIGFIYQTLGIFAEATRLVLVEKLMTSVGLKLNPLGSLYYFAPVCAAFNVLAFFVFESQRFSFSYVDKVGVGTLLLNALVAFGLNVSLVLLIGKTSSLVLTLAGVLKDVLLIIASMAIFNSPVSNLQYFGYAIALCGLTVYKLDPEFEGIMSVLGLDRASQKLGSSDLKFWNKRLVTSGLKYLVVTILVLSTFRLMYNDDSFFQTPEVEEKYIGGFERIGRQLKEPDPNPDVIVVVARYHEDVSWVETSTPQIPHVVYQMPDGSNCNTAAFCVEKNVGNEAHAYLRFIVDFYDNLPAHAIFVHGHETAWHENAIAMRLRSIRYSEIEFATFVPSEAGTLAVGINGGDEQSRSTRETWATVFAEYLGPQPPELRTGCCAQFVVSRRRILARPKEFYVKCIEWLKTTPMSTYYSGRVFEYAWHVIFGEPGIFLGIPNCKLYTCDEAGNLIPRLPKELPKST